MDWKHFGITVRPKSKSSENSIRGPVTESVFRAWSMEHQWRTKLSGSCKSNSISGGTNHRFFCPGGLNGTKVTVLWCSYLADEPEALLLCDASRVALPARDAHHPFLREVVRGLRGGPALPARGAGRLRPERLPWCRHLLLPSHLHTQSQCIVQQDYLGQDPSSSPHTNTSKP